MRARGRSRSRCGRASCKRRSPGRATRTRSPSRPASASRSTAWSSRRAQARPSRAGRPGPSRRGDPLEIEGARGLDDKEGGVHRGRVVGQGEHRPAAAVGASQHAEPLDGRWRLEGVAHRTRVEAARHHLHIYTRGCSLGTWGCSLRAEAAASPHLHVEVEEDREPAVVEADHRPLDLAARRRPLTASSSSGGGRLCTNTGGPLALNTEAASSARTQGVHRCTRVERPCAARWPARRHTCVTHCIAKQGCISQARTELG
eukprot:scaffold65610_cov55-Phaeocystis_antarctica.AAC.2